MSIESELHSRANSVCEICKSEQSLSIFTVPPKLSENLDNSVLVCSTCSSQIKDSENADPNHWRCLNDSMWSEVPAVKVVAYRMLYALKAHGWPQDLLDMIYLEAEEKEWAEDGLFDQAVIHKDSNGAVLNAGDSVVLIKDLDVKGGGFTAKRGTAVRNIRLVHDHAEHIEGKVEGQQIVILTQYVKKT